MRTELSRKAVLSEGALMHFLAPKLAQDAKVNLASIFDGVTDVNFGRKKPDILGRLKAELKGKTTIAMDAKSEEGAEKILDEVEKKTPAKDKKRAKDGAEAKENAEGEEDDEDDDALDEAPWEAMKAKMAGKGCDEEIEAMDAMFKTAKDRRTAKDETPEEKAEREEKEKASADKKARDEAAKPETVTKSAMDSAIATAVKIAADRATQTQREIRDAERAVRPWVGDLAMAFDSAPDVYRHALESLGVTVKNVHPSAFRPILEAQPKPGERNRGAQRIAQDSGGGIDLLTKYCPDAARVVCG